MRKCIGVLTVILLAGLILGSMAFAGLNVNIKLISPKTPPKAGDQLIIRFGTYDLTKYKNIRLIGGIEGNSNLLLDKTYSTWPTKANAMPQIVYTVTNGGDYIFYFTVDPDNKLGIKEKFTINIKVVGLPGIGGISGPTPGPPTADPNQPTTPTVKGEIRPDITGKIASVSPGSYKVGTSAKYFLEVKNEGRSATAGPVDYWLYEDSNIGCKFDTITNLPSGATVTKACEIKFFTAGVHKYILIVDPNNKVDEANETNNKFETTMTIGAASGSGLQVQEMKPGVYGVAGPKPDLIVYNYQSETPKPTKGQAVKFKINIKDEGHATLTKPFKAKVLANGKVIADGFVSKYIQEPYSYYLNVSFIPDKSGYYEIAVEVDPYNDIPETNENNNKKSFGITVENPPGLPTISPQNPGTIGLQNQLRFATKPDLLLTDVKITPDSIKQGDPYKLTIAVKNQGTPVNIPNIVDVMVTIDGNFAHDFTITGGMKSGEEKILVLDLPKNSVTATSAGGSHTLIAFVDSKKVISEENEDNNKRGLKYTIIPTTRSLVLTEWEIGDKFLVKSLQNKVRVMVRFKNNDPRAFSGVITNVIGTNHTAEKIGAAYGPNVVVNIPISAKAYDEGSVSFDINPSFLIRQPQEQMLSLRFMVKDENNLELKNAQKVLVELPDLKIIPTSYQITCTGSYPNQRAYAQIKGNIESPVATGNVSFGMKYEWQVYNSSNGSYEFKTGNLSFQGPLMYTSFEIKNITGGLPAKTGHGSVATFCMTIDDGNVVEESNEFNNKACFELLYFQTTDCNPRNAYIDAANVTWSK